MKCIKAIKETKSYSLGEIRRVDNQDADEKVRSGVWQFIPKSEWKLATRKPKNDQVTDQATDQAEKVQSKKQLKKQKAEA